jgi:hypothetical protein
MRPIVLVYLNDGTCLNELAIRMGYAEIDEGPATVQLFTPDQMVSLRGAAREARLLGAIPPESEEDPPSRSNK